MTERMEKYYNIAGIDICIRSRAGLFDDEKMLAPFASEKADEAELFDFQLSETLPAPEGVCVYSSANMREYRADGVCVRYSGPVEQGVANAHMYVRYSHEGNRVILSSRTYNSVTPKSVLNALGMEHLAVKSGAVILHSAYVVTELGAILFTAPSGTGKSTQAELWRRFAGATVVNGDRSIIKPANGQILACSLPFSGSSGICKNVTAPISAIVYLTQAAQNTVTPLTGYRAFSRIWEGCVINTWNGKDTDAAASVVKQAAEGVSVFHLACTPDDGAVNALYNAINERK